MRSSRRRFLASTQEPGAAHENPALSKQEGSLGNCSMTAERLRIDAGWVSDSGQSISSSGIVVIDPLDTSAALLNSVCALVSASEQGIEANALASPRKRSYIGPLLSSYCGATNPGRSQRRPGALSSSSNVLDSPSTWITNGT